MGSDLEIFNSLFAQYHPRLVRFATTYLGDEMAAEDIVMESFMSYWEHRDNLAPGSNPAAYVMTIVRNKCLNHLRDRSVHRRVHEDIHSIGNRYLRSQIETLEACNPELIFSQEAESIINRTLASLPERIRQTFMMSRFDNKTHREIASELNMTGRNVEFYISKAMQVLRVSLKDYLPLLLIISTLWFIA